ncbi:unnamed protein product [Lymnaea stagnalis]|uniref:SOCS box domain-containing protein n=1 Tax=Lymnaea stagnalis TaxID=6523 RepID=A0AAV2HDQ9_LYMST
MPRSLWKKTKQYVLDTFREEDPEEYFKYKTKSAHGLSQDELEFMQAVKNRSIQKLRTMLNSGVDPNFFKNPGNRQTPLHLAVEGTVSEKVVGVLLFFGANPNAQDNLGCSPLHTACLHGNSAAVEQLVSAGADVNLVDNYQETPLMTACKVAHKSTSDIVDLLLEGGAIVSCTNDRKQSVLHILTCANPLATRTEVWMMEDRYVLVNKLLNRVARPLLVTKLLTFGMSANTLDEQNLTPLCCELLLLLQAPTFDPDNETDLLLTAKTLVRGGAMLQIPDVMTELDLLFRIRRARGPIHAPTFNNLARLIRDIHPVIPRAHLSLCLDLVKQVSGRAETQSLQRELEVAISTLPSLLQLCKLSVRQCLGGYVLCQAQYLPLPDKMKDYICSV